MSKLKIDAPRALHKTHGYFVREVRESDWRKIMAVLRAADAEIGASDDVVDARNALRAHLAKRRAVQQTPP